MAEPKTRLFNIRIENHKHASFKKFAASKNVSMGKLLHDYIDALLDGSIEPVGMESTKKHATWTDPLEAVRSQYKQGRDF